MKPALDDYEHSLRERKVVASSNVISLLRRELLEPLGDVPLASLTRAVLVKRIREVDTGGRGKPPRPGAAKDLRIRAGVFLGWCVDHGKLHANPLAGMRRQRATRAERLDRPGRALADWELPIVWRAACAAKHPALGAYLVTRLLTGQRRSETAAMRWDDLNLAAGVWTIPAHGQKSGRVHRVPLPRWLCAMLDKLPRRGELVFAGRRADKPMSGWSKLLKPVYAATKAAGMAKWTPGDLRKTLRSGLGELGVADEVAELMIAHEPRDELRAIYNRAQRWPERQRAARRWTLHVLRARRADRLLRAEPAKVVALRV